MTFIPTQPKGMPFDSQEYNSGTSGRRVKSTRSNLTEPTGRQHGSGARGSDPMFTESTQRAGQRRQRTPSPIRGTGRPGGPLMAAEWQDQIDGLQQQIGTLNRSLSNHAHTIARMVTHMQSGVQPSLIKRL